MEQLPDYYTTLFNAVTDALTALHQGKPDVAEQILITGQQNAEERFIANKPI